MAILSILTVATVISAVPSEEVTSLPGWDGELTSKHYSGYLDFGPDNRKHIHYYFVESTGRDPKAADTPVVLWMNGGPGCSSLDGWYYEHGPFVGSKDDPKKLVTNPASWAKLANMIYIEAPVGVGFSYSDRPDIDYIVNDDTTSQDNLHAIEAFFAKFPEYKSHPFYISGESYGGVYVPTLAEAILWAVGNGTYTGPKLHGIAVGNGCTGSELGSCGTQRDEYATEFLLGQAFIPKSLKKEIRSVCVDWDNVSDECESAVVKMRKIVTKVNLYNIYGECITSEEHKHNKYKHRAPLGATRLFAEDDLGPDACIDSRHATQYFTQEGIVSSLHVKPINFTWATCAQAAGWSYTSNRPNLPRDTYPYLIENIRVLIYNGDWDVCVPYTDNEAWTESMGYSTADPWHPWSYTSGDDGSLQVGGYATRYSKNNFTFITIKGGRHEVPETAPLKALALMEKLLSGQQFQSERS